MLIRTYLQTRGVGQRLLLLVAATMANKARIAMTVFMVMAKYGKMTMSLSME
jgi:hypothetical protein